MRTLTLFNAVVKKTAEEQVFISPEGFIIESGAVWAKKQILSYYKKNKLDGFGLNKTFHKSWKKIFQSTRQELWEEQIKHYLSTYGSSFKDTMYIPGEILNLPEEKVLFKMIKAYSEEEMQTKCLELLQSGIALKAETIHDVLAVLIDELSYKFTGKEQIKNKEAAIVLADMYGILPKDPVEFLRYVVFKSTGKTLLIKNNETINAIEGAHFNPSAQFKAFGLEKLARIFNRFKPLFLAYKSHCPKTINKLSKLSKKHHQAMPQNPLNLVTSVCLSNQDLHWLDNASPFALFRALTACRTRINGQSAFAYRIRNGKTYVKLKSPAGGEWANYYFILDYLKRRFNFSGQKFYLPENVDFALPTSEKMFVGNIPTGSKFFGKSLAVGIYWENTWGARDIDISGLNIGGKVGWNAEYNQQNGHLMYSGDMTNAPSGAVEYLYAQKGLSDPTLIMSNVYSGNENCEYKIIVGQGDQINYQYMMNPNKLMMESKCESAEKQMILGMMLPGQEDQCFVLLNTGLGGTRVSGHTTVSQYATKAFYQQWSNAMTFNELIEELDGKVVNDPKDADYDFSLNQLQKDSFIKLFTA